MQQHIAGRITSLGESLRQENRQNKGGHTKYSDGGRFGKRVMKSLSFTENHPIPTFTLSKVTHGHGKTIKRSQRHLAVTKPRDQTKQNQPSRFVLLSAWQMNPLANDSKQQSSPGKCVH